MTQTNAKDPVTLDIETLSYGPYGIGRLDGKAVMVPSTAPGDQVDARIIEAKERYSIAEAIRVSKPSALRQPAPCEYVSDCGGCPWQHIRYDAQLQAKQQSVDDALRRIGKLSDYELRPIIASASDYRYRRRIRLQCDDERQLGFFQSSSHRLVAIDRCMIADDRLNDIIEPLRRWLDNLSIRMEFLEVVSGDEPGQLVVVGGFASDGPLRDDQQCEELLADNESITGLILKSRGGRQVWGKPWITVELADDLSLTVDADVFTQVNPAANRRMLSELLKAGEFQTGDQVLELYCGAGNFTFAMARRAAKVTAVEGYRPAVAIGKLNGQKLGLENIDWIDASVPAAMAQLIKRRQRFHKIVLDPPRSGAKGLESEIAALGAKTILYVSCNPATFARDLAGLTKHGYKLKMVQPIDFFPHTFHVEALGLLVHQ